MLPLVVRGLKVACVVGFPSGAVKPQVKAFEAAQAVADGVTRSIWSSTPSWSGLPTARAEREIAAVRASSPPAASLKVIIESA